MWQQSSDEGSNVQNSAKKYKQDSVFGGQQDSGIVDSGFLSSGGNCFMSSEFDPEEGGEEAYGESNTESQEQRGTFENRSDDCSRQSMRLQSKEGTESVVVDSSRADSGLDLGLSDSLSHMSLKQIRLNQLGYGKVQSEPTVELRPVKTQDCQNFDNNEEHRRRRNVQDTRARSYAQEPWELYYMQDDEGDTQLHIAIVQGFLEAAFSLIRMAPHPCLLNILNDDCQAPLHLAVLTRQARIARRLVLAGANPSIRDFRGNTPLHLACCSGDIASARALTDPLTQIERNFLAGRRRIPALPQNLEQQNYVGETCLHVAAGGGQVELVQHLLRLGADLEAREGLSGRTALHLALERGRRSVVTYLLQECRPCLNAPTYAGITAYQIALCLDTQLARELVRLGAKAEPLPESDSESSDDSSGDEDMSFMPALAKLRQGVGVRA